MKAKVLRTFYDRKDRKTCYKKGAVVDFDKERTNDLIKRKLVILEKEKEN